MTRLGHYHTDSSFAKGGFYYWKKARERFAQHKLSDLHSYSPRALAMLRKCKQCYALGVSSSKYCLDSVGTLI